MANLPITKGSMPLSLLDSSYSPSTVVNSDEDDNNFSNSKLVSPSQETDTSALASIRKAMSMMPIRPSLEATPETSTEGDVFNSLESSAVIQPTELSKVPQKLTDLPSSIQILTNNFISSVKGSKIHPDNLINRFDQFYDGLDVFIESQKQLPNEEQPVAVPPVDLRSSVASLLSTSSTFQALSRPRVNRTKSTDTPLLTVDELQAKRQNRDLLFHSPDLICEIVQKTVCEELYEQLFNLPPSEKQISEKDLQDRIAVLKEAGLDLKEVMNLETETNDQSSTSTIDSKLDELARNLQPVAAELQAMDEDHYPLGKLQRLIKVHKQIAHALTKTSLAKDPSADEIISALIYLVILSPPGTFSPVRNLRFIRRFRNLYRLPIEGGDYCLLSLEVVIAYLEKISELASQGEVRNMLRFFNPATLLTTTVRDGTIQVGDALSLVFQLGQSVISTSIPKTFDDTRRFITRQPVLTVKNDSLTSAEAESPTGKIGSAKDVLSSSQVQPSVVSTTAAPLDISSDRVKTATDLNISDILLAPTRALNFVNNLVPGGFQSRFTGFGLSRGTTSASSPDNSANDNTKVTGTTDTSSRPGTATTRPKSSSSSASLPCTHPLPPLPIVSVTASNTSLDTVLSKLRFTDVQDANTLSRREMQALLDEYRELVQIVRYQQLHPEQQK